MVFAWAVRTTADAASTAIPERMLIAVIATSVKKPWSVAVAASLAVELCLVEEIATPLVQSHPPLRSASC